jgi:hypothetical protein
MELRPFIYVYFFLEPFVGGKHELQRRSMSDMT